MGQHPVREARAIRINTHAVFHHRRGSWPLRVITFALLSMFLAAFQSGVGAQEDGPDITWRAYDVVIVVNEDGSLRVTESIVIEFDGAFGNGERRIPVERIESIEDVSVSIGTSPETLAPATEREVYDVEPGTFSAWQWTGDDSLEIDYSFERTSPARDDRIRAVEISYTVHGAIRVYPDAEPAEQQVRWTAISEGMTRTGPVESASATVIFPEEVSADHLAIDPEATLVQPDRVVWEAEELGEGESLQVAVAFPAITDAVAPAWQADADRAERIDGRLPGILLVLGLASLVAWGLVVLFMYVRGVRDPEVGLVADIIPNRPGDLPAPLVGTLVDERVDANDVLAGLLDLDQNGLISIYEDGVDSKGKPSYAISLNQRITDAALWQRPILEGIFDKGAPAGVSIELRTALTALRQASMPAIARAYEDELFARGYVAERFSDSRGRWGRIILLLAGLVLAVVGIVWIWAGRFSGWSWVPLVITAVGCIVAMLIRSRVAVKTIDGAEVAAKWRAYRRYLMDLRRGRDRTRFVEVVTRDLPWAVALGVQTSRTSFLPSSGDRGRSSRSNGDNSGAMTLSTMTPATSGDGGRGDDSRSSGEGGGLQGMSGQALGAIGGGSAAMFALLNDAAATLSVSGSPGGSSSGGSGGSSGSFDGSSSSGSSGGGDHSFS